MQSPTSSINKIIIPFLDVTLDITTYFYHLLADVTSDKTQTPYFYRLSADVDALILTSQLLMHGNWQN